MTVYTIYTMVPRVSILVPFHNERETLPLLQEQLDQVFHTLNLSHELIAIDDGSTDNSAYSLKQSDELVLISHKQRMGKGRALEAGFARSRGAIIIFMDADLQDDPQDITKFLKKLDEGYDLVNGWRATRNDPLNKTLPSAIFNKLLLRGLLRSPFHDINCGFKAMRREVLEHVRFYGDNYRFVPVIAHKQGFRVAEVPVEHHPREYGVSKYGFFRMLYGFFDTITTYFITRFAEKPLHFFGPVGAGLGCVGAIITLWLTAERLLFGIELYKRPLLLAGIFLVIIGLQIFLSGIIAELIVYLKHQEKKSS